MSDDEGWGPPYMVYVKDLPDGRKVGVTPMTFGKYRVVVGAGFSYDDGW